MWICTGSFGRSKQPNNFPLPDEILAILSVNSDKRTMVNVHPDKDPFESTSG
jgi:hypothetical protein